MIPRNTRIFSTASIYEIFDLLKKDVKVRQKEGSVKKESIITNPDSCVFEYSTSLTCQNTESEGSIQLLDNPDAQI